MKIVLCNGVFDLLHVAHLRHLEEARWRGDQLVVGVTMDATVTKGNGRPIIPQEERLELIKSLRCVADADLCQDSLDALERWKPAVFCKGYDYIEKKLLYAEIEYCKKHGIEIYYTRHNSQTTSGIIERIRKCEFA